MRYLKLHEVRRKLDVDDVLFESLVEVGGVKIKHSLDEETVISVEDAERLRVAIVLVRELDVNLPGVEVILHMREELVAMQQQFEQLLRELADEARRRRG